MRRLLQTLPGRPPYAYNGTALEEMHLRVRGSGPRVRDGSVAEKPSNCTQYLVCKIDNRPALLAKQVATSAACGVEGALVDIRPDDSPALKNEKTRIVQFYWERRSMRR